MGDLAGHAGENSRKACQRPGKEAVAVDHVDPLTAQACSETAQVRRAQDGIPACSVFHGDPGCPETCRDLPLTAQGPDTDIEHLAARTSGQRRYDVLQTAAPETLHEVDDPVTVP
jgi:hypothetical protein